MLSLYAEVSHVGPSLSTTCALRSYHAIAKVVSTIRPNSEPTKSRLQTLVHTLYTFHGYIFRTPSLNYRTFYLETILPNHDRYIDC